MSNAKAIQTQAEMQGGIISLSHNEHLDEAKNMAQSIGFKIYVLN